MPLILCLWLIIISLAFIGEDQWGLLLFFSFFIYLFVIIIEIILYHNAFLRICVDDKGISNKYFRLCWNDAPAFRVIEVTFGFAPKFFSVNILCIGDISANCFFELDPHKTIFLSLNKKTKEKIRMMARDNFPL